MRIGKLEIYWNRKFLPIMGQEGVDYSHALEVSDKAPIWLALHILLNELEQEWVKGARQSVANTNVCINTLGIGEGVAMVRTRLIETRNEVLRRKAG